MYSIKVSTVAFDYIIAECRGILSIPDTGGVGEMVFGRVSSVALISVFGLWEHTHSTVHRLCSGGEDSVGRVHTRAGEARLDLATFSFRSITIPSCNGER